MRRSLAGRLQGLGRIGSKRRMATGIATLLVVVIASGAALIATQNGKPETTPTPAASKTGVPHGPIETTTPGATASFDFETGGWGWRRVVDPSPGLVARIANGYLGECVASGLPAACTSKDGVAWALPADRGLFAVDGSTPFGGWSVAHGSAGWVATGTIDPGAWRSSDGLNWSAATLELPGLQRAEVQSLEGGFAMVAQAWDGQGSVARLLTTTDGAAWTSVDLPAGISGPRLAGAIGLLADRMDAIGDTAVSHVVSSRDGLNWTDLSLPDGVGYVGSTVRLPSGAYAGIGTTGRTFGTGPLLTSADGLTWKTTAGPGPVAESLVAVGHGMLAIASIPNTALMALWQSTDAATWQRIAILDGDPLTGNRLVSLGDGVGLLSGSKLTLVGTPLGSGSGTVSPGPSASFSASGSPMPPPSAAALIVGGWRWHQLTLVPDVDATVVRVPNGYFSRCGGSMCTSPNGWSWRVPADPAVFATDGPALFLPLSVAHRPDGGYVVSAGEGVWYSLDGVHWKASPEPVDAHGFRAVTYGSGGFALLGSPDDSIGGRSRLYESQDGAVWTDAGTLPMVGVLARGDTSGGILTLTGKTEGGAAWGYSADGRTWVKATEPATEVAEGSPYRLEDGRLAILGGESILRSTDGRSWVALKTGWVPNSLAVAGDRMVAVAIGSDNLGTAWESTDEGATFHKLVDGASRVYQFGDHVLLYARDGAYVGAPLPPSEAPGTTATATGLPARSPAAPTRTTAAAPPGGISRAEAIRIATNALHAPADQAASASAGADLDNRYGRWVWRVSFLRSYGGPLDASGTFADIDFFTGEILASGDWIS